MPEVDMLILLRNKRIRIHQENDNQLSLLDQEIGEAFKNTTNEFTRLELRQLFNEVLNVGEAEGRAVRKLNKVPRLRRVK